MDDYDYLFEENDEEVISEEEFEKQQFEINKEIKLDNDFDNFLDCFFQAREYFNFYHLQSVPAYEVFDCIKNLKYLDEYEIFYMSPIFSHESDIEWCLNLINSADPEFDKDKEIKIEHIFYLYKNILNMV